MAKLVITEICDDCDEERPTSLCSKCGQSFCTSCLPQHWCVDERGAAEPVEDKPVGG